MLWNKRLGTTNESGPWGQKVGVRLPMGVPLAAGSIVTQGGLIFFGGGMDRYFRAFDVKTGDELWRDYLPAPAQATPMSYLSPQTKRQIVVITVPGTRRVRHGGVGRRFAAGSARRSHHRLRSF